jgi:hypothetical protein
LKLLFSTYRVILVVLLVCLSCNAYAQNLVDSASFAPIQDTASININDSIIALEKEIDIILSDSLDTEKTIPLIEDSGVQNLSIDTVGDNLVEAIDSNLVSNELSDTLLCAFVKYKVEHGADSMFFNVLKIENKFSDIVKAKVKFSYPDGWTLISEGVMDLELMPNEIQYLPLRVALSKDVVGERSYVIQASIKSSKYKKFKASCYIGIPKVSNWDVSVEKKIIILDAFSNTEKLKLNISNNGNSMELIKIVINSGSYIGIGENEGTDQTFFVQLEPNMDTIIVRNLKFNSLKNRTTYRDWKDNNVKIFASTAERNREVNLWFKKLYSEYYNKYEGMLYTPLTIDVMMTNLLSTSKPFLNFYAGGHTLFKNDRSLSYYFRSTGLIHYQNTSGGKSYGLNLYQRSQFQIRYMSPKLLLDLGQVSGGLDQPINGNGLKGDYKINETYSVLAAVARNITIPINSFMIGHRSKYSKFRLSSSFVFRNDNLNIIDSYSGAINTGFSFLNSQTLSLTAGLSRSMHNYTSTSFVNSDGSFSLVENAGARFSGLGLNLGYNGRFGDKLKVKLNGNYGSLNHSGASRGRLLVNGVVNYKLSKKSQLLLMTVVSNINPNYYYKGSVLPTAKVSNQVYNMVYSRALGAKTQFQAGPGIVFGSLERYNVGIAENVRTAILTERFSLRINHRINKNATVSPVFNIGYSQITDYSETLFGIYNTQEGVFKPRPYLNSQLGINARMKNWGINGFYYYGPENIYAASSFAHSGTPTRRIQILPYYNKFIWKDVVELSSYNSYMFTAANNISRFNGNINLNFHLSKGWVIKSNYNIYLYSKIDPEMGKINRRSMFLNFGFVKRFDWDQPKVKYYDLKVVTFKDLNGDRSYSENEPLLDNIIVKFERNVEVEDIYGGSFRIKDLITNEFGEVNYYRIPQGSYKFTLTPLRNLKTVVSLIGDVVDFSITEGNKTIYVPYVESYKIIGKLIVELQEYSSAGKISLANVKITASDSSGNIYSTLTDKDGNFILFLPLPGIYDVKINNVFGENFEIDEEEYVVDFNGVKVYKLDFVYKEKKRGINFNGEANVEFDFMKEDDDEYLEDKEDGKKDNGKGYKNLSDLNDEDLDWLKDLIYTTVNEVIGDRNVTKNITNVENSGGLTPEDIEMIDQMIREVHFHDFKGEDGAPDLPPAIRAEVDDIIYTRVVENFKSRIKDIESQIDIKKKELKEAKSDEEKQNIQGELDKLNQRKGVFEDKFENASAKLGKVRANLDLKKAQQNQKELPENSNRGKESQFSKSKKDAYLANGIPMDEQLPDGLIYRIQLGVYSKLTKPENFKGLYPLAGTTISSSKFSYATGIFYSYEQAIDAKNDIQDIGITDSFVVAYKDGEHISVAKAMRLE